MRSSLKLIKILSWCARKVGSRLIAVDLFRPLQPLGLGQAQGGKTGRCGSMHLQRDCQMATG